MTIVLENPKAEARLQSLATASGKTPGEVVASLLETLPTAQELARDAEWEQAVWNSLTDEERDQRLNEIRDDIRASEGKGSSTVQEAFARIRSRNRS